MSSPFGDVYTVKKGDTLSALAAKSGTPVAELARLNGIKDPNKIRVGATLMLRQPPPPPPTQSGGPIAADHGESGYQYPQEAPNVLPKETFNPTSDNPGPDASALLKEVDWRKGDEGQKVEYQIPVAVDMPPPPPDPVPPTGAPLSGWSESEQAGLANRPDPGISAVLDHPLVRDLLALAIETPMAGGIPRMPGLMSGLMSAVDTPPAEPFRDTPGRGVSRAITPPKNPNHPWYKPRPWDNPMGEEISSGPGGMRAIPGTPYPAEVAQPQPGMTSRLDPQMPQGGGGGGVFDAFGRFISPWAKGFGQ